MSPVTWIKVPFRGARAVSAPATWGQRKVLLDLSRRPAGTPYNVTVIVPVPEGVPLERVLALIGEVVDRNEALRTLFTGDVQRVLDAGEVEVGLCSADSPDDLLVKARELDAELERTAFDHSAEPPFRALVCSLGGRPQAVVVCVAHLAADLQGTRLVGAELDALLNGREHPRDSLQPVDVAERETTPAGARREERALAHLRTVLESFPAANLPRGQAEPDRPRFWRGVLDSTATEPALGLLSARYATSTSTIALAAVAAVLKRLTGRDLCGLMMVVGNRIPADQRHTVGSLTQTVPMALDLTGPGFAELVRAAWPASLKAARHGGYDPVKAEQVIAEVTENRGARPDLDCFFNDMRADITPRTGPLGPPGEFRWVEGRDTGVDFFLELGDTVGAPGVLRWILFADTAVLPKPVIEDTLREIERLLVGLAEGDLDLDEVGTCVTTG